MLNSPAYRTHAAGTLRPEHVGESVVLSGFVHHLRRLKHVAFLELREGSGRVQVVLPPETAAGLTPESSVRIEGTVVTRQRPHPQPHLYPTGQVEVNAHRVTVLNASGPLPFSQHENPGEEEQLRHRPLALRWAPEPLIQRAAVVAALRRTTEAHGFVEVETPVLVRRTPGGAAPFEVPVGEAHGYALAQSPQIWKQLLVCGGIERYAQLAHCFRNEGSRPDRQPEFSQFEIEMAFSTAAEIQRVMEEAVRAAGAAVGVTLPEAFPRLTHAEAMARFGSDKPHLGNPLELVTLAHPRLQPGWSWVALPLPRAPEPAEREAWLGLLRRGAPAGGETGTRPGGAGLPPVRAEQRPMLQTAGAVLWAWGPTRWVQTALGEVRNAVGQAWGLVAPGHFPLWVERFPLFEPGENGVWAAAHHPFTRPAAGHEAFEGHPETALAEAFDLVLNGAEIGGGSMRVHEPALQARVFAFLGLSAAEQEAHFGPLLEALRTGAPPHGGMALGVERLVATLTHAPSIRSVMAFPKTTGGQCPLTHALSERSEPPARRRPTP